MIYTIYKYSKNCICDTIYVRQSLVINPKIFINKVDEKQ